MARPATGGVSALVVAGLLVLAGCSALVPGGAPPERAETLTPVPLEPTATETAAPTPTGVPVPGVDGDTVTDLDALLAAHVRYLAARSYTLAWTRRVAGGSDPTRTAFRREYAVANGTTYRRRAVDGGDGDMVRTYVDPTGRYRHVDATGETSRREAAGTVRDPRRRFAALPVSVVDLLVDPDATEVRPVARNGTRYALLVSRTAPRGVDDFYADADVRAFTAAVWVHPDGYLRTVSYEFTLNGGREPIRMAVRYDYTAVGETAVTRPAWVARFRDGRAGSAPRPPTPTVRATTGPGTTAPGPADPTSPRRTAGGTAGRPPADRTAAPTEVDRTGPPTDANSTREAAPADGPGAPAAAPP